MDETLPLPEHSTVLRQTDNSVNVAFSGISVSSC